MRYRDWDLGDTLMAALAAIVIGLVVVGIIAAVITSRDCAERGGEMVGNGTYTTTFVQSGNVMVPIMTENTECTK